MDNSSETGTRVNDFGGRFVDNLFRRWYLVIVPVLVFGSIGVISASTVADEFESEGSLSASENPLVEQQIVRGTEIARFESPAGGTARLINEQLVTDSFVDDVAARAGLDQPLANGVISRELIRSQVGAFAEGENILTVKALWGDPGTAFLLVDSTIAAYLDYVESIVSIDSQDAEQFWETQLSAAQSRADTALDTLQEYVADLPPLSDGEEYPIADTLTIDRLNAAVGRSTDAVAEAQDGINRSRLAAEQARTEAFRKLRVIDAPIEPVAPESNSFKQAVSVAMFTLIGLIVGLGAILLGTVLDRSITSSAQLARLTGTPTTVALPHIKNKSSRLRRSSPARKAA